MLQIDEAQQHRAEVLLKRIEEYRVARIALVQQLEDLDVQARVVQREFNALHNSFAPIASLPEELLAIVFEAGTHLKRKTGVHFAILVSHVTRGWRNIALTTPRLWATICCVKSKGMEGEPYPETGKERTTAFLARSRSSPVEIYIRHCFMGKDLQLLQLISKHFGRFQHFSIVGIDREDLSPAVLTHFSHQPAPLLESFELGSAVQLKETLFPSGAPRLTTAQIGMLDLTTFHFCLPAFQSVTSLRLASIYIDDDHDAYASLREGLMALPSLTHLELQESYVQVDLPCPPVVLPALRALHASSSYMYGFLDFLGPCIHGASLTVLTLQGAHSIEQVPEVYFPSLRHLILLEVTKTVPGLAILSHFPSIQRLTCRTAASRLQSFQIGIADVLAALGPGPHEDGDTGHRIPCPQLHTVAVSGAYCPLDVMALTAQLSTLQDNGIPIRKLMLPESSLTQLGDDLEAIAELRKFVEIEDFQIDWPTPFDNVQFTEM